MKLAETPEEQRRWMAQWHSAGVELEEFKREELVHLTQERAWQQTDALLSLAAHHPRTSDTSGLVAQQAWFRRARR